MNHPSPKDLAAFVMGIAPRDPESLRRHLAACPECARRLEREARLESLLHEAAHGGAGRVPPERSGWTLDWRPLLRVAAVFAIVAVAAWIISRQGDRTARTLRSPTIASTSGAPGLIEPMRLAPGYLVISPAEVCREESDTAPCGPPWDD